MKTAFFQAVYFPNINAPTGPAGPETAVPVVAAVADATGTEDAVTKLNQLLANMREARLLAP